MKKKILLIVAAAFMLNSCDDLFEPAKENFKTWSKCTMMQRMLKVFC